MLFNILVLLILSCLSFSHSSEYPPDYPLQTNCLHDFPITVCIINKDRGEDPRIEVMYNATGMLWKDASPLHSYVKLNENNITTGRFVAFNDLSGASYTVNQWSDMKLCYHATTKDDPNYGGDCDCRCPVNNLFPLLDGEKTKGYFGFFWFPAPENEENLIQSAKNETIWNIEVAMFNEREGQWY